MISRLRSFFSRMSDSPARSDVPPATFARARRALQNDETTCETLAEAFLKRIEAENESLNALSSVDGEGAISHARSLDDQVEQGRAGPLAGLVLAVKDVISATRT